MDTFRYSYADDWLLPREVPDEGMPVLQAPVFENTYLDTVLNVSIWTHPALVANLGTDKHVLTITGAGLLGQGAGFVASGSEAPNGCMAGGALRPNLDGAISGGATHATPQPVVPFTTLNLQDPGLTPAWRPRYNLFAYTDQAGDAIQFTTDAQQIKIRLLGYTASGQGLVSADRDTPLDTETALLHSAEVRNGAQVAVQVDGEVIEIIDTWRSNPWATIYLLDGEAHTITVSHSGFYDSTLHAFAHPGDWDPGMQPIGRIEPLVTVGLANTLRETLSLRAQNGAVFISARWRAVATLPTGPDEATTFSLYETLPDDTETLVMSGLQTGVSYTDLVPGVDLYVAAEPPLMPDDSVTWTTDVVQMGIQEVILGWGDELAPASYTSAPLDAGDPDTQWFCAEWFENTAWGTFALQVGDLDSDGTVRWRTIPFVTPCRHVDLASTTDLPGVAVGSAGLAAGPRGQFARWTLTTAPFAPVLPYARDLALYFWTPDHDKTMGRKLPLGEEVVLGPVLGALVGTLETFLAGTYSDALRLRAGTTIAGATDEYLANFGRDLARPQYLSEPPMAYRARLSAEFLSSRTGGSLAFIAERLATLIFGAAQEPTVEIGMPGSASYDAARDPVVVRCAEAQSPPGVTSPRYVTVTRQPNLPPQSYMIVMPPTPYQGLMGLTRAQIERIVRSYVLDELNPAGSVIDFHKIAWQLFFPWGP